MYLPKKKPWLRISLYWNVHKYLNRDLAIVPVKAHHPVTPSKASKRTLYMQIYSQRPPCHALKSMPGNNKATMTTHPPETVVSIDDNCGIKKGVRASFGLDVKHSQLYVMLRK